MCGAEGGIFSIIQRYQGGGDARVLSKPLNPLG
jgi:hypothetical protein